MSSWGQSYLGAFFVDSFMNIRFVVHHEQQCTTVCVPQVSFLKCFFIYIYICFGLFLLSLFINTKIKILIS